MPASMTEIEQLSINAIRTLSMDAVQQANSGHPGTPMALAPVTYSLWNEFLRFDPSCPQWMARDRFVLSCGHASMLLYSILHLTGVQHVDSTGAVTGDPAISLDAIRKFRQLGSPCAGHPEFGDAAGIETTTGPLGQGVGNSVGMAIAANWLATQYNQPGFDLFGYNVYALCSDGDLMEGVANEAASLAGHFKLSNLCWIYDDNRITIEGETDLTFSENVAARFAGLGWHTVHVDDANDIDEIKRAIQTFLATEDRPTIIILRSVIGWGSPNKENTSAAHGAPLGEDEVRLTKEAYGWPADESFLVPEEVKEHFAKGIGARGKKSREQWEERFKQYEAEFPQLAEQIQSIQNRALPEGWDKDIPEFPCNEKGMASRVSSGKVINAIAPNLPWFVGGSADLAPSTMTLLTKTEMGRFGTGDYAGRNFHFGIREHGMAAILNGMSLSGLRPFGATFFVFTDYLRPSMRLSAIMHQPVLYVFTHDSIGLGEDGPTHQPVEHLAVCRAIPRLVVIRPSDANEVAACYRAAIAIKDRPVAMVLTRQGIPTLDRTKFHAAEGAARGAYVLSDPDEGTPQVILIGTGSEVTTCLEAANQLSESGVKVRVVSMPSWELFDAQDAAYREQVLPPSITARVAVEAGVEQGWQRYLGSEGRFVGMSGFGASGPYQELYEHFGITAVKVAEIASELSQRAKN